MTKKALIVSPYLDHLGGGERYMLSVAAVLESLGHAIYFAWDNTEEITKLGHMLGIELKNPAIDPVVKKLYFGNNPLAMFQATRSYDTVVYLSDGSIPLLGSRNNIVHMQVPFHGVGGKSWQNQIKRRFVRHVIVNSEFTKKIIDQEYGLASVVLYPPVSPITCSAPKENIVLSVGRFEPSLNTKKQDILIEAFKALSSRLPGWKMILAGASASDDWVNKLRAVAGGFPIELLVNVGHDDLCALYAKSKIYWHAAGYGIDETKNPELTEHFGISTVEAISAECIPLVVPSGGQREIVNNPDLQWTSIPELIEKTFAVVGNQDPHSLLTGLKISDYTADNFATNLGKLIK